MACEDWSDPNKKWYFTVGTPALITTWLDVPLTKDEVSPFYSGKKSDFMKELAPRIYDFLSSQASEEGGMASDHGMPTDKIMNLQATHPILSRHCTDEKET